MYYWVTGIQNNIFLCTFSIDKKDEATSRNKAELSIVEEVIKSIKTN